MSVIQLEIYLLGTYVSDSWRFWDFEICWVLVPVPQKLTHASLEFTFRWLIPHLPTPAWDVIPQVFGCLIANPLPFGACSHGSVILVQSWSGKRYLPPPKLKNVALSTGNCINTVSRQGSAISPKTTEVYILVNTPHRQCHFRGNYEKEEELGKP